MEEQEDIVELEPIEEITQTEATSEDTPQEAPSEAVKEDTPSEPVPSFSDTVKEIKAEYEAKLAQERAAFEAELKERDDTIKQILTEPSERPADPYDSIVDTINKKRNYRKW